MQTTVKDTTSSREPLAAPAAQPTLPALGPRGRKTLLIVAGVVLAALVIAWGVMVTGKRKEAFAARGLDQARNVAETGNLTQASTLLQQLIQRFPGTSAAQEAVLTLN